MKYVTKFETQSAYTEAESSLILPNVSLIAETNGVSYKPVEPAPSHDFVEIGGIKWATMNVGANSVTDYGLYFQWGDTQGYTAAQVGSGSGQKYFDWTDYKYSDNETSEMTKYNETDGKTVLDASDDAVTAAWGGSWRMPTEDEFLALTAATTSSWVTDYQGSGINGRLFTDKTDSSKVLFFPAAGSCYRGSVSSVGSICNYWIGLLANIIAYGRGLYFYSGGVYVNYNGRCFGYTVRGVLGS